MIFQAETQANILSIELGPRCVIQSEVSARLSANVFEAYSCERDKIDGTGNDDDGGASPSSFGFFQKFILNAASATTFL